MDISYEGFVNRLGSIFAHDQKVSTLTLVQVVRLVFPDHHLSDIHHDVKVSHEAWVSWRIAVDLAYNKVWSECPGAYTIEQPETPGGMTYIRFGQGVSLVYSGAEEKSAHIFESLRTRFPGRLIECLGEDELYIHFSVDGRKMRILWSAAGAEALRQFGLDPEVEYIELLTHAVEALPPPPPTEKERPNL